MRVIIIAALLLLDLLLDYVRQLFNLMRYIDNHQLLLIVELVKLR